MKVSIVTAVLNARTRIEGCLESVRSQSWPDLEHIVVDGGSTDGTVEILRRHEKGLSGWISEPDAGMYDAVNKGISRAEGDVIGLLHADDRYADERVVETVVSALSAQGVDACWGDLLYVRRDRPDRVLRRWTSGPHERGAFLRGWMPPHPTFFVRRSVYERYGLFDTRLQIAADYELMLRLLHRHGVSSCHIPRVLVRMESGGKSNASLKNILRKTREDFRAWTLNGLPRRWYTIPVKNLSKLPQFL